MKLILLSKFRGSLQVEPSEIRSSGVLLPSTVRARFGLPDNVTGRGGDIVLNAGVLSVSDGAQVSVSHNDLGDGGSLQVNARQALLRNYGKLLASTQSGNGGNIQLMLNELLLMRDDGLIDTESLGTGNGGNIIIDAPIIFGLDNSDIIANAITGNGGNINITTQAIYGLEFRHQLTPENDITASSQLGVSGTVDINSFSLDPGSSLVTLPAGLADASNQVDQGCSSTNGNKFITTGRGGLPIDPTISNGHGQTWFDTRILSSTSTGNHFDLLSSSSLSPDLLSPHGYSVDTVIGAFNEASTWHTNATGQVELIAAGDAQPNLTSLATCTRRTAV